MQSEFTELRDLIDETCRTKGPPNFPKTLNRRHLGASIIGRKCKREIYYSYRWFAQPQFPGRVLRLFRRGHLEEFLLVDLLRQIGAEVEDYDPATIASLWYHPESECYHIAYLDGMDVQQHSSLASECLDVTDEPLHVKKAQSMGISIPEPKQFKIKDYMGHLKGSTDGRVRGMPFIEKYGLTPQEWLLLEFKTHGLKSFEALVKDKVKIAKPEHYTQMNVYMHHQGLRAALYMAVNKNTDDLHTEIILYDQEEALAALEKACEIINTKTPPKKIGRNASAFACKFCDYRGICHLGVEPLFNCRTCQHSIPTKDGRFHCTKWKALIPEDVEAEGCKGYERIKG